jgi:flagellar biosynthesis/type III secretory pathway protein FliH
MRLPKTRKALDKLYKEYYANGFNDGVQKGRYEAMREVEAKRTTLAANSDTAKEALRVLSNIAQSHASMSEGLARALMTMIGKASF